MTTPSRPPKDNGLSARMLRRRVVPAASAAAALCVAGCAVTPTSPTAAPLAPDPQAGNQRVHAIATDIEAALDNIDRERLRAAEGKARAANSINNSPIVTMSGGVNPTNPAPVSPPEMVTSAAGQDLAAGTAARTGRPISKPIVQTVPIQETTTISKVDSGVNAMVAPGEGAGHASLPPPGAGTAAGLPNRPTPSSTITPLASPSPSPASAMGSMTAVATAAPKATSAENVAPSPPPPAPATASAEPSLEEALAVIRKNISVHPTLGTALAMSLLDASPKSDAPDPARGLSDSDHKILGDLLTAIDSMKTASSGTSLSERAAPLLDIIKRWQADADLSLPRLCLASRVDSFGVFTAIEPKFEQGKRHTVIIYCEVANFSSKKAEDGWYATHLSQQETLITEDGLLVWRPNAEDIEDRSLNQRHDFYMVKKLTIPENLAAGKYTLRMTVTDRSTNKIAILNLPIEVVAR